jgi:hypothetical protein
VTKQEMGTSGQNGYFTGTAGARFGQTKAYVNEVGVPPPVFTAISPDTGYSSTDQITDNQNLTISGTSVASATITVYRSDLATALGTTTASGGGACLPSRNVCRNGCINP